MAIKKRTAITKRRAEKIVYDENLVNVDPPIFTTSVKEIPEKGAIKPTAKPSPKYPAEKGRVKYPPSPKQEAEREEGYVRFCPRCQSIDIAQAGIEDELVNSDPLFRCNNCGYFAEIFPQTKISDLQ